jgi:protein-disulfide isomerase
MTVEGNPNGAVRVIAFDDLQCSDCAAYRRMLDDSLLPRYGREVAFENREFPLPKHEWARDAAIAVVYFASISGQLAVAFRRYCFGAQREVSKDNIRDRISEFALLHGLEYPSDEPSFAAQVDSDYREGLARGVQRTPTVFIDDQRFIETFSVDEISSAIDTALSTAVAINRRDDPS